MSDRKSAPALGSSSVVPRKPSRQSLFRKLFFKESFCAWIFIAPALIGFTVFYLIPCVRALYISLTDWNLLRAAKFVGPANYPKLWSDPNFWNSMRITVFYVLYNIPLQTVIGLFQRPPSRRQTKR
jgi:ABC-type sugar transport system permease subunit